MQNRYTGDIGDFGKIGLLRALQFSGLSIGVNWYLVPDEGHNADGKFTQYDDIRSCDEPLWHELRRIVETGRRKVSCLENERILKACFFSAILDYAGLTKPERIAIRSEWHRKALDCLSGMDLIFADPDNGLLVPSSVGTSRDNKYVKPEELRDYYMQGASVVYYQHKARRSDDFYFDQHRQIVRSITGTDDLGFGLKFRRTSQRFFFFIVQPSHKAIIALVIQQMLSSEWKSCFEALTAGDSF